MSGIAGILYKNNRPVHQGQLIAMAGALPHRGFDGVSFYRNGQLGFVHFQSHYAISENLYDENAKKIRELKWAITFHGRLDNRVELIDKICTDGVVNQIADDDIVLLGYQKWGKDCVDYLLGDFAFAIWDVSGQTLFCARDRMGVMPFYYYNSINCFAFASEPKALFTIAEIPYELNKERVADFLTCVVTEKEDTFFNGILKLKPGYCLNVNSRNTRVGKYYDLRSTKLQSTDLVDYQNEFREIFVDAVRCRLSSTSPVGAYLSGGLDSTSIVCVASELMGNQKKECIHTFSGIFEEVTECDERKYFQHVLDKYPVTPHYVSADKLSPGQAYDELIEIADEPPFSPHFFMKWNLSRFAQRVGVRVVLDGHDGDSAVSYGIGLFPELALQGRLFRLFSEFQKTGSYTTFELFKKIASTYRNIARNKWPGKFGIKKNEKILDLVSILHPEFAKDIDIERRITDYLNLQCNSGQIEQEQHLRNITHPLQPYMAEFLEKLGSTFNLSIRFPYFDQRIIEFCLSLPAEEKFSMGYNRSIVRQSLKNWVPRQILERKSKTDFAPNLLHAFGVVGEDWLESAISDICRTKNKMFNIEFLHDSLQKYRDSNTMTRQVHLFPLIRAASLVRWLDVKGFNNV